MTNTTLKFGETFKFSFRNHRGVEKTRTGYLFYAPDERVLYIMQKPSVLKDAYTDADRAETARLNAATPLRDGDTVVVEGLEYGVKILGDFSDAGRLVASK